MTTPHHERELMDGLDLGDDWVVTIDKEQTLLWQGFVTCEGGALNLFDQRSQLARVFGAGAWHSVEKASLSREPVGFAEREVGRYVYKIVEALMDAKPGTPQSQELAYLARIVSDVEEFGGEELALHEIETDALRWPMVSHSPPERKA